MQIVRNIGFDFTAEVAVFFGELMKEQIVQSVAVEAEFANGANCHFSRIKGVIGKGILGLGKTVHTRSLP